MKPNELMNGTYRRVVTGASQVEMGADESGRFPAKTIYFLSFIPDADQDIFTQHVKHYGVSYSELRLPKRLFEYTTGLNFPFVADLKFSQNPGERKPKIVGVSLV